jgi:hypothetical protein
MNCKICHGQVIQTYDYQSQKTRYLTLFRKVFPKRPIELVYCRQCYSHMVQELETEINSQAEHQRFYQQELKVLSDHKRQEYSITNAESPTAICNDNTVCRYQVISEDRPEYLRIKTEFENTLKYKILRIEKSNNPILEEKFKQRSKQLTKQENIKYLFHGSADKAYDSILETGFDLEYASPYGLLGKGIYFAEDSSYSHGYGRVTRTNLGSINHILYCKVNLGHTCQGRTGLTSAPDGYDAVEGSRTYAVFDNYQGIPEYIIYYLVE